VGFNRPDFLRDQLEFLSHHNIQNVIVSIDRNEEGVIDKEIQHLSSQQYSNFTWRFRENNLGVGRHIPTVVSEVLMDFENCIVLEDDVRISAGALKSGLDILSTRLPEQYLTVGFFGGFWFKPWKRFLFGRNCWRETEYFSAWGWGIQRESWSKYNQTLDTELIETELSKSKVWNRKSLKSKTRWLSRFMVVAESPNFTWDYQMQYATYISESRHLLPIFSTAENCGFEDLRSTNTKSHKPRWNKSRKLESDIRPRFLRKGIKRQLLIIIDRATWAGDSNFVLLLRTFREFLTGKTRAKRKLE
jgi:hypothetical protein